ncbi:Site-specific DNA-adenine methylase [Apibacter mensalis]|uniref:site-specific DNA-methyltransferase (adenine-specific) n=1 Tax=Apibacter mensalis TaxID=1586267 RepID=A0A0X3AT22_9FLAO|nr:DNA adenine methylase [Apibacter mensalis]CVK17217.1 Site-specific DNA-adenine methylase [Apibacter mensalis]
MKKTSKTLLKISFSGSKANRVIEINELIKNKKYKRVVEVFGGSCCISNNLKRDNIVPEVVANDYDKYFDNFEYHINYKEKLINQLIELGFEKSKRALCEDQKEKLQNLIIKIQDNKNLLKYLSKNFVFSAVRNMGDIKVSDFSYFMNDLSTKQDREFYINLKNVHLDSLDYKDFLQKYITFNDRNTLIIVDPPYLNSFQKQYSNGTYFGLCETIRLLKIVKQLKNDFIFFNMIEKDSIELLNLFGFNYTYNTKNTNASRNNIREDFLAYITFDEKESKRNTCLN